MVAGARQLERGKVEVLDQRVDLEALTTPAKAPTRIPNPVLSVILYIIPLSHKGCIKIIMPPTSFVRFIYNMITSIAGCNVL